MASSNTSPVVPELEDYLKVACKLPHSQLCPVEDTPEGLVKDGDVGQSLVRDTSSATPATPDTPADPSAEQKLEKEGYKVIGGWDDKPTIEDQIHRVDENFARPSRVEAVMLDMTKPEDIDRYNTILSKTNGPMASGILCSVEKREMDWRYLCVIQWFEFKKIGKK